MKIIKLVDVKLELNITMGAIITSFGLPGKKILNTAFISLAVLNGLTCLLAIPKRITKTIRATDPVIGKDPFAIQFIENYQGIL